MMKKFFSMLTVLGFVFFFAAASASDAGKLPFEGIVAIVACGVFCLVVSRLGMSKFRRKELTQTLAPLNRCAANRAG